MNPALIEEGIVLYDYIQVFVAFAAVLLALHWKKHEFLAGLFFLFLYSIVEVVDVVSFAFLHTRYLDMAQFGFILLAIVFLVIGMHTSLSQGLSPKGKVSGELLPHNESLLSLLKKF